MTAGLATAAVIAVTIVNLALVAVSSIFAIYGDGSAGGMPLILVVGSLWVLAFTARAIFMINKGERGSAVSTTAKALPYALLALILFQFVIALFH